MSGFDSLLGRRPPPIARPPSTARVVRTDDTGVWAVPLGGDTRHPTGPCRGGAGVPLGAVVLLVLTDERPWIAGWEEP